MNVTSEDRAALTATLNAFAGACNDALAHAKATGRTHRYAIQADIYKTLKTKHGLRAMYAVRACDRVAGDFAAKRVASRYSPTSATVDKDLVRYIPKAV